MTRMPNLARNDNDESGDLAELERVLERAVEATLAPSATFAEREAALLRASNEAVRRVLEARLQRCSDDLAAELWIGGLLYRKHQPGTVQYFSLCGNLRVRRWTYRHLGERNGPTLVPLELTVGLVERSTPALAYSLAQGYAKAPIRSVARDLTAAHRIVPSRCTLERMAKKIGTKVRARVDDLEPVVRQREDVPTSAIAINLGLDRTSIPMEEPVESTDNPKARVAVRYRMGYVGTVTITDREAQPLCTRRYAVPACEGPHGIVSRLMADLEHALGQRPDLRIGVVQDNAPELWHLMRYALAAVPAAAKGWCETVDRYHLMEFLGRDA